MMTTEQKALAYDEALRKIRPLYEQAKKEDCPIWSTYEYIFPELRESEDEKTRKEIIEFIRSQIEDGNSVGWDRWIAYLEKHKESLHIFETCKENADSFTDTSASTMIPSCWETEQKEQKPKRERNKPKESWLSKAKYELAHEEELLIKRQKELSEIRALKNKEQKSAEYGDDVVEEAEEYTSKVDCGEYGVAVTEAYIAGVLSERNRKPAEWSEEDEDKLEQCIRIVSGWEGDYDIVKSPYSNFLKSLRPSWKPSKEQMNALESLYELLQRL